MRLYLIRHAEAKREEEDPLRPLSDNGRNEIGKVTDYISKFDLKISRIFHSTKLRSKQTAKILAEKLKPQSSVTETDGLHPLDSPNIWRERLDGETDTTMLVGHLPHLNKLASLLLCGNDKINFVPLHAAGIICLERDQHDNWIIKWMLSPEIILNKKKP